MVLVGHHSDKTGERCWHVAISGFVGAIAFAVSAVPGISGVAGLLALTVATAGLAAAYTTFWALPSAFVGGMAASASIAWINSVGNLGGYLSPFLVGKIRDVTHHTTPALLMLSGCCVASTLLTILFFRKRPQRS
jgi:nitrate/nitrite transporter NarK